MIATTNATLEVLADGNASLSELIDRAARDLHRNLSSTGVIRSGLTEGFETDLTNYLLGAYLSQDDYEAAVDAALAEMVDARMRELIVVDCLLDETDERSYTAVEAMTQTLLAAVRAQRGQHSALCQLVTAEIVDRQQRNRGTNCPGCSKPRLRHADAEFGALQLCLNPSCSYDK